jgi:hypothetical protein
MNLSVKKIALLGVTLGMIIPVTIYGVGMGVQRYKLVMASQAAAAAGFNGVTAVQAEIMNCKLPVMGKQIAANTRTRAVAADGSLSEVIRYTGSDETQGIIRRADGAFIRTYEHIRSKTSVQTKTVGHEVKSALRDPAAGCLSSFSGHSTPGERRVGEEILLGHLTIKTVLESEDRRRTSWMAPGIGCFEVQALLEFYDPKEPGKVTGNSLIITENLVVGPPDPALFGAPSVLVERKPSEITLENYVRSFRRAGHQEDKARALAREKIAKNPRAFELDNRYEQIKLMSSR